MKDVQFKLNENSNSLKFSKIYLDKLKNPATLISIILLLLIISCALFADLIAPTNPYDLSEVSILDSRLAPGEVMFNGTIAWLGTDGAGRDVLSAIIYGLRTSLIVALSSAFIAIFIGLIVGLIAGYFGGFFDAFLMRVVDIQLSFPAILVALVLLALLGKGIDKVIVDNLY